MPDPYGIHPKYGIPREMITCPGDCNRVYRGKACQKCENCKSCCQCDTPMLIDAEFVKQYIAENEHFPTSSERTT